MECMYDGCNEEFESHDKRLEHSMRKHTELNADKYPHLIGSDSGLKF